MARVLLHVGTHKTATTTIQDMFAHNAPLLQAHGVIYPRMGRFTGHHGLVSDWGRLPKVYAYEGGSRATLHRLGRAHGGEDGTLVLSSEEFSRGDAAARVDFDELRDILGQYFEQVDVVCVLREQWQFIQSVYLEVSKNRVPGRPGEFVWPSINRGMIEGLWTDYNLLYDHLRKAFDAERITLLDFDTARRANGGIVGAILALTGTGLAPEALDAVNDGMSNRSPKSLPTWAANVISEPRIAPGWLIDCATSAFHVEYGDDAKPCLFTRAEFDRLAQHFRPLNDRLQRRVAGVQPGFAITENRPDDRFVFRDDINQTFWLRCSRWVFNTAARALAPAS
jgi:hypothetical protein